MVQMAANPTGEQKTQDLKNTLFSQNACGLGADEALVRTLQLRSLYCMALLKDLTLGVDKLTTENFGTMLEIQGSVLMRIAALEALAANSEERVTFWTSMWSSIRAEHTNDDILEVVERIAKN